MPAVDGGGPGEALSGCRSELWPCAVHLPNMHQEVEAATGRHEELSEPGLTLPVLLQDIITKTRNERLVIAVRTSLGTFCSGLAFVLTGNVAGSLTGGSLAAGLLALYRRRRCRLLSVVHRSSAAGARGSLPYSWQLW